MFIVAELADVMLGSNDEDASSTSKNIFLCPFGIFHSPIPKTFLI